MAAPVSIEIVQGTAGSFTFAVGGSFTPSFERIFKTSAEPPELERIIETWEITGALLTGTTVPGTFDSWDAVLAVIEDRTVDPVVALLLRRGSGPGTVEQVLGPSTVAGGVHQEFKLEILEDDPTDSPVEAAAWGFVIPVTIRATATRVFPDGNGIVGWEQEVTNVYPPSALHEHTRVTTITAAEGASSAETALELAKLYAVVPISSFGNTYTFLTNGPDGIDFTHPDADETNSRTPTVIVATSKIKQWGITVGAASAGNTVGRPGLEVVTTTKGSEITIETTASAVGPQALGFARSKIPGGPGIEETVERNRKSDRDVSITWTQILRNKVTEDGQAQGLRFSVKLVISGGGEDGEHVPIVGPFVPQFSPGPLIAWRLVATISVEFIGNIGGDKGRSQIPFPRLPGAPWRLLRAETREDAYPDLVEPGASRDANRWVRTAEVVMESATKPSLSSLSPFTQPAKADTVETYLL